MIQLNRGEFYRIYCRQQNQPDYIQVDSIEIIEGKEWVKYHSPLHQDTIMKRFLLTLITFSALLSVQAQSFKELWNSFEFSGRDFYSRYIPQTGLPYDADPISDLSQYSNNISIGIAKFNRQTSYTGDEIILYRGVPVHLYCDLNEYIDACDQFEADFYKNISQIKLNTTPIIPPVYLESLKKDYFKTQSSMKDIRCQRNIQSKGESFKSQQSKAMIANARAKIANDLQQADKRERQVVLEGVNRILKEGSKNLFVQKFRDDYVENTNIYGNDFCLWFIQLYVEYKAGKIYAESYIIEEAEIYSNNLNPGMALLSLFTTSAELAGLTMKWQRVYRDRDKL
jgi:hypothetical protein